jgi:cyclopropane fatty-acyl-phospholipid synthase-like methyltransferase
MKDDGLFLVHGMTQPWAKRKKQIEGECDETDALVKKHFGIGHWHSLCEVIEDLEREGFEVLDVENITRHYQYTVERWLENLQNKEEVIVDKIIPEEKYREFFAFMASYVVGFEFSGPICQQILCQKVSPGELRKPRPFLRKQWSK